MYFGNSIDVVDAVGLYTAVLPSPPSHYSLYVTVPLCL